MADVSRKVSLIFEADTSAAKNSINELVKSLQSIQSKPTDLVNTDSIKTASKAALELQEHLRKAVNVDTGKLDLSRFVTSLNSSKKTLEDYRVALNRIGPEGNRAFIQLAHNINNSETSTVRLNKTMQNFLTTLKNTVKWQISSNITHGLESTISHAYNYAKQLDGVLNDIRIVSGKSAEEMANFAVAANKSAQELSTTTSKYAEASLIFFQQGLSDAAVKERTDAVIKMASVTGEAMTDVSSYMTAIWNNFADGTKNLEYYSDVIVKLGADTASSSEEIAGGLEKFIAIGDQIGLSYEYAAAALTTITAQTRQSEDVVGTALRTIFARIQGLNLGETLDDGTTLNKYSSALQKVGVDIKDTSGQLKDMDVILDDLGSKWGTLGRDTQIALAQTVGGVRQYNQIIALMDNWEFFQKNLQTAYSSEGSLDKQFGIYEESWRAAEQRVKAAAEGIYDALLDEKVFIQLDNLFTGILNVVQGIVEGMGGMVPILATIGGFITTKFAREMPVVISNFKENLSIFTGKSESIALKEQKSLTSNLQNRIREVKPGSEEEAELVSLERISRMREELLRNQKNMNSAEIEHYQNLIKIEQEIGKINVERARGIEQSKLEAQESASRLDDVIDEAALNKTKGVVSEEELKLARDYIAKEYILDEGTSPAAILNEVKETYSDKTLKEYLLGRTQNKDLDRLLGKNKDFAADREKTQTGVKDEFLQSISKQKDEMLKYAAASGEVNAELSKLKTLQNNTFTNKDIKETEKLELGFKGIKQSLQDLKNTAEASGTTSKVNFIAELEKQLNNLEQNDTMTITQKFDALQKIIKQLNVETQEYRQTLRGLGQTAKDNLIKSGIDETIINEVYGKTEFAAQREKSYPLKGGTKTPIEEPKINTPGMSQALTELAGTAMEVYGAIQAVQSAWDIFANPDTSGLEKIGALIGVLTTGFMSLNTVISLGTTITKIFTSTKMLNVVATAAQTGAHIALAGAISLVNKVTKAGPLATGMAVIAVIGAIIGAITLLVNGISNLINKETEEEKRLKELKEQSEALGDAQEKLAQKISDVESAWDNYQNMVTALEECTAGTQEWNDALLQCNQSVLTLLSLAPGLAQFVQYNPDGTISLGGVGYEQYMEELTRQNAAFQAQKLIVDSRIAQAELETYGGNTSQELKNIQNLSNDEEFIRALTFITGEKDFKELPESTIGIDTEIKAVTYFMESLVKAFGNNIEGLKDFLINNNIMVSENAARTLIEEYYNNGNLSEYFEKNSIDTIVTPIRDSNLDFLSITEQWTNDLLEYDNYERSAYSGYATLFGALEDYDVANLQIYGREFEELISKALEDSTKTYATEDKDTLKKYMVDVFGGDLEDYSEYEVDEMQYLLAIKDVSSNLETLDSIIATTNNLLNTLNSTGQSLYRSGDLASASLNKLGLVGQDSIEELEDDKDSIRGINFSAESLEPLPEIAASDSRITLKDFEEVLKEVEGYKLALSNEITYGTSTSPEGNIITTYTPEERRDLQRYDILVAKEAEDSLTSEEFLEYQQLLQNYPEARSRPTLTFEQAVSNYEWGNSVNWKDFYEIFGFSSEQPFGSGEIASRINNEYESLFTNYNITPLGEEDVNIEKWAYDIEAKRYEYLSTLFSPEDAAIIATKLNRGVSIEEAIDGYVPVNAYQNWINAIINRLGDNLEQILSEDELIEFYDQNTSIERQYEILTSHISDIEYTLQREANVEQEIAIKDALGIDENTDFFQGLKDLGIMPETHTLGNNYILDWNAAKDSILNQNPEVIYRAELLQAVGADENEYDIIEGDEAATRENIRKFAEEFQLFTIDELDNLGDALTWEKVAERFNELVIDTMESAIAGWNISTPERFKVNYQVDEYGKYFMPEGQEDTAADELFMGLRNAGASSSELAYMANTIGSISTGIDSETFESIKNIMLASLQDGVTPSEAIEFFTNLVEARINKGSTLSEEEIAELDTSNINLTGSFDDLIEIIDTAASSVETLSSSFNDLLTSLDALQVLQDLTTGTEISEEEFNAIKDYIPEEYRDLFLRSVGGYTYYGTDEQGTEIERISRERVWAEREEKRDYAQAQGDLVFAGASLNLEDANFESNATQFMLKNLVGNEDFREFLMASDTGLGSGNIEALISAINNNEFDNGRYIGENTEVNDAISKVLEAITNYYSGEYEASSEKEEQLKLSSIGSLDELYAANISVGTEEGQVTPEQYAAVEESLFSEEMSNLGFDYEQAKLVRDSILAQNEELEGQQELLNEITIQQMRHTRAIENAQENSDEWVKNLKEGNKALEKGKAAGSDYYDAVSELGETYADLFDVDVDDFSDTFIKSTENAELLQKALEGDQEALDELQSRAMSDILTEADVGVQIVDGENLTELSGQSLADRINAITSNAKIEDLEIGTSLDDDTFNALLGDLRFNTLEAAQAMNDSLGTVGLEGELIPYTAEGEAASRVETDGQVKYVLDDGTVVAIETAEGEIIQTNKEQALVWGFKNARKTSDPIKIGSGRRSGGGGGGGGGGGSRAPRAERKTSTDKDRYRTVQNQLEDLTNSYDKVSTAADRAFGETKLELLKQQEKAIQDLIAKQREYIDEINEYYDIDRQAVEEVSSRLGFAVEFDANGTITNWDEIQNQMIDEYNSHINDKGEVIGMDEEAWSEYEKEWERVMELFNQYDETQDLRKEALQQLQDYANQLYDLQLQEVTYVVEIKIDATDDALEILDYMLGRIEDDAWAAAEAIAFMGQKAAEIQLQNNTYTEGIRGILMNHTRDLVDSEGNIVNSASLTVEDVEGFMSGQEAAIKKIMALNEEFTDEEVQQLREYNSSLIEMNETLNDLRNEVFDKVLDSFEAFNDEMDRSIDKIDHLSSLTENYANIIDIVGQKNLEISNALMESISQATVDQATNRVEATREKMLTIQDEIARAEEALADAKSKGLEEDVKLWEDTLKEMNDSLDEAEEEFLQSWEDALSAATDAFEASMDRAISAFGDALAGPLLGSLEQLEEMFDRQNTIADRYLPDYEKIYELNKLNRDITNSIDETDNIRAKQELAALQEEINKLEEDGVQVSEYQVENLRRRYELKLAELALTESQNAKSEVRMTRNADGDWSYVYVADEEQVAEAEQNYEDKLFAMQQANAEYINNLNDMLIQLRVNTFNSLQEIWEDETLSQEEKIAKTNELFAYAQEQMEYYMDELGLVLGENQILYEQDWAKYSELTGYKISANEDYVDHFNETALSLLTGYETMEEFQQNFNDAIGHPDSGGFLYDLDNAFKTWEANTEEIFNSAGTSMEDFKDVVEDSVNDIVENSEEATESIEEMGDNVVSTFDEITSAVQNWSNVYSETIDSILARNEMLAKSFNELLKAWAGFEETTEVEEGTAPGEDTETGNESDSGETDNGENVAEDGLGTITIRWGRMNIRKEASADSKDLGTVDARGKKLSYVYTKKQGVWVYVPDLGGWVHGNWHDGKYTYLTPFDTGGYTGSWGAEGRVAMLHEKELVLNKQDTSNLLAAVGMIRDISKIIDLNAYASSYGNIASTPNVVDNTGTLEQQVHITAEFPNATDKDEILSAFDDIINLASQYANRR